MQTAFQIQPTHFDTIPESLADLATAVAVAAAKLESHIPKETAAGLAKLVRYMNCYYTNKIERSVTELRDIERVYEDTVAEDRSINLFEARRHVQIQTWIDDQASTGTLPDPASAHFLLDLHRRFFEGAPGELLTKSRKDGQVIMTPGRFRATPEHDNEVGRHVPPPSDTVEEFMRQFERHYRFDGKGQTRRIIDLAASHHRLLWIHPFIDGNGRVTRLMSHAMAHNAGIGAHGLWAVSRGLARYGGNQPSYKAMVQATDIPRQGDLDGRGHLSQRALLDWCTWFLEVALDQIAFMAGLFDLSALDKRLMEYVAQRGLRSEAIPVLLEAARRSPLSRGEAALRTGLKERSARDLIKSLLEDGILTSPSAKGALSLAFSVESAEILFPRLIPD